MLFNVSLGPAGGLDSNLRSFFRQKKHEFAMCCRWWNKPEGL